MYQKDGKEQGKKEEKKEVDWKILDSSGLRRTILLLFGISFFLHSNMVKKNGEKRLPLIN